MQSGHNIWVDMRTRLWKCSTQQLRLATHLRSWVLRSWTTKSSVDISGLLRKEITMLEWTWLVKGLHPAMLGERECSVMSRVYLWHHMGTILIQRQVLSKANSFLILGWTLNVTRPILEWRRSSQHWIALSTKLRSRSTRPVCAVWHLLKTGPLNRRLRWHFNHCQDLKTWKATEGKLQVLKARNPFWNLAQ